MLPWFRRAALGLVAAIAGAAVALAVAASAGAADNGFWRIDVPRDDGTSGEALRIDTPPGESVTTELEVTNLTRQTLDLDVAPTAALAAPPRFRTGADGKPTPAPDVASWLTVAQPSISLGPGQSQRIEVLLRVPATTAPGDYVAAVITSGAPVVSPLTLQRQPRQLQIRYDIRVEGEIRNALDVGTLSVDGQELALTLENTGNTRLRPTLAFEGTSAANIDLAAPAEELPPLEPGERRLVTRFVSDVPKTLTVTVASEAGVEVREWPRPPGGAQLLTAGGTIPAPPDAGDPGETNAILIGVGVVLGTILLIALIINRRHARAAKRRRIERARRELARRRAAAAAAAAAGAEPPALPPGFEPTGPPPPLPPVSPSGTTVTGSASGSYISGT